MKKIINVFISIMIVFSLFGCNYNENSKYNKMIKNMTLRDKIAQMIMVQIRFESFVSDNEYEGLLVLNNQYKKFLQDNKFGGVILFLENIDNSIQVRQLIKDINEANDSVSDIPLFIGVDQEGGRVGRVSFGTSMPGNMALAASYNEEDVYKCADIIGKELKSLGFNLNFAPVVDVNSNPSNPVIGNRSFSDDPELVSKYSNSYVQALNDNNVIACIKHFPGHGDTSTDSHTGLPLVNKTLDEIRNFELVPFKSEIENGVDMIMSAHIQFPNIDSSEYIAKDGSSVYLPATLSKTIITDVLREELGFDGVVISDSLRMDAIKDFFELEDSAKLSINAGVDILLMPVENDVPVDEFIKNTNDYIDMIVRLVENNEISEDRINESVLRILKLKDKESLFDKNDIDDSYVVGSDENHAIELDITKDCITLIENNDVLPIEKDSNTLVMVPYNSQLNSINYVIDKLNLENVKGYNFGSDNLKDFEKNIANTFKDFDNLVIVSAMYDIDDINNESSMIIDLALDYCKENGIKTTLLSSHLPYDLSRYEADSKIACYYASGISKDFKNSVGDNIAFAPNLIATLHVIFKDGEPLGKLPINIPQLFLNDDTYEFSSEIAYQRGYGLTYK